MSHITFFTSTNLKQKLTKVITNILQGNQIKANEQILIQLRKNDTYPLTLCQILAESINMALIDVTELEQNKNNFIALQVKKMSSRTENQQCWRLMREVYFCAEDKIAKLIKETCLLYKASDKNNNLMHIFFSYDLRNAGLVGLVRYLTFLHQVIMQQTKYGCNETLKQNGYDIVDKLLEVVEWDLGEDLCQFVMTELILLYEVLGQQNECWKNIVRWNTLLERFIYCYCYDDRRTSLSCCLAIYLKAIINNNNNNHHQIKIAKQQYQNSSINYALKQCLQKTHFYQPNKQQKLFYFDCVQILGKYWTSYIIKDTEFQKSLAISADIIQTYSQHLSSLQAKTFPKIDFSHQEQQADPQQHQTILHDKKFSLLKVILSTYNQQQLTNIISLRTSYPIQMIQFLLYIPNLTHQNLFSSQMFQSLINDLQSALENQTDTYMFAKDNQVLIYTLLQFIVKFHKSFDRQMILKICYVIDFLVYRCDTISQEGFMILDLLTQDLVDCEAFELVEFLTTTLSHINQNQWLQTSICYYHAINILLNLNPHYIFQRSTKPCSINYHPTHLQTQIITMIKKTISILQSNNQNFNYETMHKLNLLIQYILQPEGVNVCEALSYGEIAYVVENNFKYQILTEESADVYFYFLQFYQNKSKFTQNLNLYNFWEECQSEKLQFFTKVYLKFIDPEHTFFKAEEIENQLRILKRNLWKRFSKEEDDDEREKIAKVFYKHKHYLGELYIEAYRTQQWGENSRSQVINYQKKCSNEIKQKMEIE